MVSNDHNLNLALASLEEARHELTKWMDINAERTRIVSILTDFVVTLNRGGRPSNKAKGWDTEGTWRLKANDIIGDQLLTVVTVEEMDEAVEPSRPVVGLAEVVTATCVVCQTETPVFGVSSLVGRNFGDTEDKKEIIAIHCKRVQPQPDQTFEASQAYYDGGTLF